MTRERGVPALRRDVFDRVPGEGRWHTVLLADGNIGIGGDPVRLLQRVRTLLATGGRVVVELGAPGTAVVELLGRARGQRPAQPAVPLGHARGRRHRAGRRARQASTRRASTGSATAGPPS